MSLERGLLLGVRRHARLVLGVLLVLGSAGHGRAQPPEDFPRFHVPGHESAMASLRALHWLHYPGAGPKSTMWDEWLAEPALWPAVGGPHGVSRMREEWRAALAGRILDPEGYVATHQHASIAHQLGWPFPFWTQGARGWGWHFSFQRTVGPPWRPSQLSTPEGWTLNGLRDLGVGDEGWNLVVTNAAAVLTAPEHVIDTFEAPFLQIRWRAKGWSNPQPFVEWRAPAEPDFGPDRRFSFDAPAGSEIVYAMIPLYRHPRWTNEVAQVRLGFGNREATGEVALQALFTQFDTRHNINSQSFLRGCANYFWWTRDLAFLRANINRLRTALRYLMTEHGTLEHKVVLTRWVGHDGRSGILRDSAGQKRILHGHGIGNNYWDLLPFGHFDAYATLRYYDTLRVMAALEREIRAHPEWNVPGGVLAFEPAYLEAHAAEVKVAGNRRFWNLDTGRFVACVDADGRAHDYGFTFLNLEAIDYDFATPDHARSILSWITGERTVPGDTSTGTDIYHWRFAPRATTRRNVDWYFWAWSDPESIPWGGQVQDGGAVLGFSYHDLMARLSILGPANAWSRLREILRWFDEVQAAGGYRKYYNGQRDGTLQGGGTAGGLGMDHEFFESVLVPQVMLRGFLGFEPAADGFSLDPRLPADWPELTVDRVRFQDLVLRLRVQRDQVEIRSEGGADGPRYVRFRAGEWAGVGLDADGRPSGNLRGHRQGQAVAFDVDWARTPGVRFSTAAGR